MVVVYNEEANDSFIITAFLTRRVGLAESEKTDMATVTVETICP